MREGTGPFPVPHWRKRLSANILPPLMGAYSGEAVAESEVNLGAVRFAGEVTGVWMSVNSSGKDDAAELNITGEVYINDTTVLSTTCGIAHISGETAQQKTTKVTGDTGVVQSVIDTTQNTFSPGDVITGKFMVQRTATPTTEISNPCLVVELEPTN